MNELDQYLGCHGRPYQKCDRVGYTSMPVLHFLTGLPLNELTMNYLEALRPSALRVVKGSHEITCDAQCWRVTVYLKDDGTIESIEQEVAVGLRHCEHGYDLSQQIKQLVKQVP